MNAEFRPLVFEAIERSIADVNLRQQDVGKVLTSAGPAAYQGDILQQPDLLWTDDQWDDARIAAAQQRIVQQGDNVSKFWKQKYEQKADFYWHEFYKRNTDHFYKDRHYLHVVFPELLNGINPATVATNATASDMSIQSIPLYLLEVGCGVGNAILPLLELNPQLHVTAIDFAASAISILDKHPLVLRLRDEFQRSVIEGINHSSSNSSSANSSSNSSSDSNEGDISPASMSCRIRTSVCCIVNSPLPVPTGFMDLVLCMFVLSAIGPTEQLTALKKCADALKVGGKLLIRDYGRYDEAQLRFKKGSKLDDNFYVRQDGTCAYFFTIEQLQEQCALVGLEVEEAEYVLRQYANRQQRQARYRVWVHAKFRKLPCPELLNSDCNNFASCSDGSGGN